ncbi:MAG: hypothetical protein KDC98_15525 [Planctomycetes bacterium]|nr:hypothetical protein [Planctomycetota bacterium]
MQPQLLASALGFALAILPAQDAPTPAKAARFTNLNHTFMLDLPPDFRQVAPNEARRLADNPATPLDWRSTSPRAFYAVGPVDLWLAGDTGTPWLYVLEQGNEWHIEGDFATQLAERWRQNGEARGVHHTLADIHEVAIGPLAHKVWMARRTSAGPDSRAIRSIDIYAPTGGRQVTLSLCAWDEDFARWQPEFERWLSTLTFSRPSRGEQTLSDRLWTPLLTGGIVGLVLLALYKHSRRSR